MGMVETNAGTTHGDTQLMQPLFPLLTVLLLSGCVQASEFLSGPVTHDDPAIRYPISLEPIQIGLTTQEEIQQRFGQPTDLQISSKDQISHESWAYASADPVIQPYQYVPFFGALAFSRPQKPESFSVNFSQDGFVEGLSWRTIQPFGKARYDLIKLNPGSPIPIYGTKNPMVRNLSHSLSSLPES